MVGLDRAPPHLFHLKHDNAAIVKVLGGHHDSVVTQYSIWAITENPGLGLANLGVPLHTIEQQPGNVRAWMFQLVGMSLRHIRPSLSNTSNSERAIRKRALGSGSRSDSARTTSMVSSP